MAIIAVIQNMHPMLASRNPETLSGFTKQLYEKFFDVLVEESGHDVYCARNLDEYRSSSYPMQPHMVVCAPFPEEGNLAPAFQELGEYRQAFPKAALVVWTERQEAALRKRAMEEFGVVEVYAGNLISAADDFADMVLKYMK